MTTRIEQFCRWAVLGSVCFTTALDASACPPEFTGSEITPELISQTLSNDPAVSQLAIAQLRAMGQPAVDMLCHSYRRLTASEINGTSDRGTLERWRDAIDAVAKQKDAHASGLFWHTDFQSALSEAQQTGRPILSLRLLGNLDEDRSCANSRFFRSVLYANASVSSYLRDHFVLHWQSLRPVPKLTIDFGDGRRIERTITGNSIHYVLDSNGEVIDAIPGLYTPGAFLQSLQSAEAITAKAATAATPAERESLLREFHLAAKQSIDAKWRDDLARLRANGGIAAPMPMAAPAVPGNPPDALRAAAVAPSKSGVERPALRAMNNAPTTTATADAKDTIWDRVAALHSDEAALDDSSIALMRAKSRNMPAVDASRRTVAKWREEDPFLSVLNTFRMSLAADTARNEYEFHRVIHQWLAASPAPVEITEFNKRVYAELFLTPLSDPWMGLAPANVYAALDGGGLCEK